MHVSDQFWLGMDLLIFQERCPDEDKQFLCSSGECISREFLCDGSNECIDGSDETHNLCQFRTCSQSYDYIDRSQDDMFAIHSIGNTQSFRCGYGACISPQFTCDGIRHCVADGSDETKEICRNKVCGRHLFQCDYGGCIQRRNICDNRYHCFDKSDETKDACNQRRRSCPPKNKFRCANGACVRKTQKCNGIIDCLDESDESEETCGRRPNVSLISSIPTPAFPIDAPRTPATPPTTTTISHKDNIPGVSDPSVLAGAVNGCHQVDDPDISIEIIQCGDGSNCHENVFPVNTVMIVYCDDNATPLRCQEDNLWHFARDPARTPIYKPCQSSGAPAKPPVAGVSTSGASVIRPRPADCGIFPPLSCIPWLVALFRLGQFACTGALIGQGIILTAGHCVVRQISGTKKMNVADLKIQYKSKKPNDPSTFASVSHIEIHPSYTGGPSPRFDIALVFLSTDLGLGSACLDDEGKILGKLAWTFNRTMGQREFDWSHFQQTLDTDCFNRATLCSRHLNIGTNQFCGTNEDSPLYLLQGSSGGPYMIEKRINGNSKWFVAGVVSYSISTSECGTPTTVFTSVSKLRTWIEGCAFEGKCAL